MITVSEISFPSWDDLRSPTDLCSFFRSLTFSVVLMMMNNWWERTCSISDQPLLTEASNQPWTLWKQHRHLKPSFRCVHLFLHQRKNSPWCSSAGTVLCSICSSASSLDTPSHCAAPVHWPSSAPYMTDTWWWWSHSYPHGWPAGQHHQQVLTTSQTPWIYC